MPLVPQPGESVPWPTAIFPFPSVACCKIVRVPHQTPRGLAPAIVILEPVTFSSYASEVGSPAASTNSVFFARVNTRAPSPFFVLIEEVCNGRSMPIEERSDWKVCANWSRVGGMNVSPVVSLAFADCLSTMIDLRAVRSSVPELEVNGTVGMPTRSALTAPLKTMVRSVQAPQRGYAYHECYKTGRTG